eukprot:TRINITY_DN47_c0_g1::TRINITY_DN47_c0_g1_i1::g.14732::m.14732 TRINITY_DN47_c0_g1::TRINITY_DN47_c0_g1_i1::g.14732  ORF type:complete len:407 (-),score=45.42,sp/Q93VB2/AT18A_ARATH/51.02/8e-133,WD40/PF00400.27/3.6e+03,WD40/PF00400.27/9.9e+03,WD40/PF00400.27/9.1,WD40/PF00400.27/0.0024,CPSF_A/PF03178.10/2.9,CPSF_A/PF03178.10/94 TRINITY_DN47_c0_g1_i1:991-2211(-)
MVSMNLQHCQTNELLYIGFNQDQGCFACGTENGFRIYNCDPFKETFRRDFHNGGVGLVEMLFRCNILALVGGGKVPRYPPNKVMIWDDHQSRCIGELSFRNEVKAVKLRRDRIVVVLEYKIYVYNFADLKLLHQIETVSNPKGLCAVCPQTSKIVLACPALHRGHVRIEMYDIKKTSFVPAHEASLANLALNMEGTRLATCSEKGTLIRIFDTYSAELLQELRRGSDKAEIYSLCFSPKSEWLCCSSDKGTIHVFNISEPAKDKNGAGGNDSIPESAPAPPPATANTQVQQSTGSGLLGSLWGTAAGNGEDDSGNRRSSLAFMRGILPKYFSSVWSFAQFRVPDSRTVCAFGAERNSIIIVSAEGSFYKATFDEQKGGDCKQKVFARILKNDDPPADPNSGSPGPR